MRTLLYILSVRNAIKRKKDLFSLKRSATCAMTKNNLLKRFATSARAEVAQLALCASNCGMPTSDFHFDRITKINRNNCLKVLKMIVRVRIYLLHLMQVKVLKKSVIST